MSCGTQFQRKQNWIPGKGGNILPVICFWNFTSRNFSSFQIPGNMRNIIKFLVGDQSRWRLFPLEIIYVFWIPGSKNISGNISENFGEKHILKFFSYFFKNTPPSFLNTVVLKVLFSWHGNVHLNSFHSCTNFWKYFYITRKSIILLEIFFY